MKKLLQEEFVTKALSRAKRPIDLSRFEYKNSAYKSIAICPEHGEFLISANALMNRIGCPHCALIERSNKRRMSLTDFISRANEIHHGKYNYSMVEYTSAQAKVRIICPEHGEFTQVANSHLSGKGCAKCRNAQTGDRGRMSPDEFLLRCAETHGTTYDLSRVIYKGMSHKIEVICPTHGSFFPQASNFVAVGSGCPECGRERVGLKSRKPFSHYVVRGAKKHAGKYGYTGLFYKNSAAYLNLVCPEHGEFTQLAQSHLNGIGCEKCARPVYDTESFIKMATKVHGNKYDYSGVTYTDALEKVQIICAEHGEFWQSPTYHVNMGNGCPRCAKVGPSKGQLEILEFLRAHTEVIDRFKIGRKEADIYLPEHNVAVEYHGLIWHSTKFATSPTRDFQKHKMFEKHGIRIIHIYQDEWECRRSIVEKLLLTAIGRSASERLFARKLTIGEISESDAAAFYDQNHIQGGTTGNCVSFALYNDTAPVAVMSFSRIVSMRGKRQVPGEYELRRFATSINVVGGASKLLRHFINTAGDVKRIVSYSDNRLFNGGMYAQLGFQKDYVSNPSYCYVTNNTRLGRLPKTAFKRSVLPHLDGFTFDPALSERENCEANGYYQLHDCGKTRWVFEM